MNSIQVIAKDIRTSLLRERRKLDDARNSSQAVSASATTTDSAKPATRLGGIAKWPTSTRVTDRIKKMWNEDIERSVRRMQTTDWERMGKAVESHMKRARERMITSLGRIGDDSSKKNST
jgi:Altered inheritance of mitochondria 5